MLGLLNSMLGLAIISHVLRITTSFSIASRTINENIRINDSIRTNSSVHSNNDYRHGNLNLIYDSDARLKLPPPPPSSLPPLPSLSLPPPTHPPQPPPPPPPICHRKLDAVFLLQNSANILRHYENERSFVKSLADMFVVQNNFSRAGLVTWSEYSKYTIHLTDHSNITSFIDEVDNIQLSGTLTNIEESLEFAEELFGAGRPSVPKLLILITDDPHIDTGVRKGVFDELTTQTGISVIAILIGFQNKSSPLSRISEDGVNFLHTDSLAEEKRMELIEYIIDTYCNEAPPPPPPRREVPICSNVFDIVILLNSYGGTSDDQRNQTSFIKSIATVFVGNQDFSRAGFIVYSNNTQHSIKLNEYWNMTSFFDEVDAIPLSFSPMNVEEAVRFTQRDIFDIQNGTRLHVPKLLIMITVNSESMNVSNDTLDNLRGSGINVVAIGIGMPTNSTVLSQIAGGDDNVFHARSFHDLLEVDFMENITDKYCKGPCRENGCQMIAYRSCPDSPPGCGVKNNESCEYLAAGRVSNPTCARNACSPIISNGKWQPICDGIQAFEIIGPCNALLARGLNGSQPFEELFITGFHGIRGKGENGTQYSGNVKSVKLMCSELENLMMPPIFPIKKGGKDGYSRNAGVVLSVGFVALIGSGFL